MEGSLVSLLPVAALGPVCCQFNYRLYECESYAILLISNLVFVQPAPSNWIPQTLILTPAPLISGCMTGQFRVEIGVCCVYFNHSMCSSCSFKNN